MTSPISESGNAEPYNPGKLLDLVADLVHELHPETGGVQRITLSSALDSDLGLDSLSRVELISRVERHFALVLPESAFAAIQTVEDLLNLINLGREGQSNSSILTAPIVDNSALNPTGDLALPVHAQTLVEVVKYFAQTAGSRVALQMLDEHLQATPISYQQLLERGLEVAYGLQDREIEYGDTVAIMLPTSPEYFYSFLGIMLAGAIPVPIYPPARISQLEDHLRRHCAILCNCQAKALVTLDSAIRISQLLRANTPSLRCVVTTDELRTEKRQAALPALDAQSLAFLQYTSGSTGNPKGVMLTHANLLANVKSMGSAIRATTADVFVSWLPLYHDMGLIGAWLGSLYHGIPLVIMPPTQFLTRPQRWLWAIHRFGGTLSAAPNFAYELCLRRVSDRDIEGLDLKSWRFAFNGAEPVGPTTLLRFSERFGHYGFQATAMAPVYGLAECAVGLCIPPLGRIPVIDRIQRDPFMNTGRALPVTDAKAQTLQFVACGYPIAEHEVRIVDGKGNELPERHEGQLQFRGPSATAGYFRNPEATSELVRDGWLQPGDRAYIAAADIYITGRTKDIIIRAGRNIYPHELEEAIGTLTGVRQGRVAVFGSQDSESGTEKLVVVAETRVNDAEKRNELQIRINAVVTSCAGNPPDDIVLAPPGTVLRTSSGKVRRSACRELYENKRIGAKPTPLWMQMSRLAIAGARPTVYRNWKNFSTRIRGVSALMALVPLAMAGFIGVMVLPKVEPRWRWLAGLARVLGDIIGINCKIDGLPKRPEPHPSAVYVSNHCSYSDVFVLFAYLPRLAHFVAKVELQSPRPLGIFLERIGTLFVERTDRERSVADSKKLANAIRAGQSLWIFPEGTFSRKPELLPFHMGAFITAAQTQVPVVPVAIHGTRAVLRDGTWLPRPARVTITIGPPISPETGGDGTNDPWQTAVRLRSQARSFIAKHCHEPDQQTVGRPVSS